MKTTKNPDVGPASITMLAIPITGAAQSYYKEHSRPATSAYEQLTPYPTGFVAIHDYDECHWRHRHGWRQLPTCKFPPTESSKTCTDAVCCC